MIFQHLLINTICVSFFQRIFTSQNERKRVENNIEIKCMQMKRERVVMIENRKTEREKLDRESLTR